MKPDKQLTTREQMIRSLEAGPMTARDLSSSTGSAPECRQSRIEPAVFVIVGG